MTETYIYRFYKLSNPKNNYVYIGSTTLMLNERLNLHKTKHINNNKYLCLLFGDNVNDVVIEKIKEIVLTSHTELSAREIGQRLEDDCIKYHKMINQTMKSMGLSNQILLNQRRAYQSTQDRKDYLKQRYINNREKLRAYQREYARNNREHIKKYNMERYSKIRDGTWKPTRKGDYDFGKRKESIKCECGGKYIPRNIKRHLKTKRHLFYEEFK